VPNLGEISLLGKNSFLSKTKVHLAPWQPKTGLTIKNCVFSGENLAVKGLKPTFTNINCA